MGWSKMTHQCDNTEPWAGCCPSAAIWNRLSWLLSAMAAAPSSDLKVIMRETIATGGSGLLLVDEGSQEDDWDPQDMKSRMSQTWGCRSLKLSGRTAQRL